MFQQWWLRRASEEARARIAHLEAELAAAAVRLRLAQAELDALAAVIARDRMRVQAETATYARQIAASERGEQPG